MVGPKLIVGLGNPGSEYAATRHNLGFAVLDGLAGKHGISWRQRLALALVGHGTVQGSRVILAKPQTFMNLSGRSAVLLLRAYGLVPGEMIVVHDDMDLEIGIIRVRRQGGSGGHRGVQSLIEALGSHDFGRLRLGIGRPPEGMDAADYVLQPPSPSEELLVHEMVVEAVLALETLISRGYAETMNRFNRRQVE